MKNSILFLTALAFVLLTGFLTRTMNLSSDIPTDPKEVKPLAPGAIIPKVNLITTENKIIELKQFVLSKPTILIFYRGGWCPYCNTQLSGLQKIDEKLRKAGYEILAVSPDKPEKLKESIGKHKLSYRLLSDSNMVAAKAFGVAFQVSPEMVEKYKSYNMDLEEASGQNHHLLPVPSVFIIGKDQTIKYRYFNPDYKVRLDADSLYNEAVRVLR